MEDTGNRIQCYACDRVSLQRHHELTCPLCSSEFTEIIEIPPDTEPLSASPPDPPISVPGQRSPSPPPRLNTWLGHDPWAHHNDNDGDEEDEDDDLGGWNSTPGFTRRTYRSPNGRITVSSTTFTHGFPPRRPSGPREVPMDPLIPMVRGLDTLFQTMAETHRQHQHQHQHFGPGQTPAAGRSGGGSFGASTAQAEQPARSPDYSPTGGLFPRDADGPQPMGTPLRTLGDILELFRNHEFGHGPPGGPGVRVMHATPLTLLSALLNLDRNSDAVYSQEELDRVISQLVDQNVNRTAAPPAAPDAIRALPKKSVDQEMLGNEGKAECSICMDSVDLGTEVTVLPCRHWFHEQCIEMWLNQHNTCPHCRRSIDPTAATNTNTTTATVPNAAPPAPSEETSGQSRFSLSSQSSQPSSSWNTTDGEQETSPNGRSSRSEESGGWASWVRNRFSGGGH